MRLRTGITLAAAVAATAGLALAFTVPAASAAGSSDTITVLAKGGTSVFVNARRMSHPAAGDYFVLHQPLYNPSRPSAQVGEGAVVATLVGGTTLRDEATVGLPGGQISLAGTQQGTRFTLAITGGTGKYNYVHGQATVHLLPGKGNRALIALDVDLS
jgi:hypothetical protein